MKQGENVKIGQFNIIHESVMIGNNVEIGNFNIIEAGVKLRDRKGCYR